MRDQEVKGFCPTHFKHGSTACFKDISGWALMRAFPHLTRPLINMSSLVLRASRLRKLVIAPTLISG